MLLESGKVSRILIFDLDVHQGDGTAFIFDKEPAVCTVSIHCQSNFPTRKQTSSVDIGLPDGTADDAYLKQAPFSYEDNVHLSTLEQWPMHCRVF